MAVQYKTLESGWADVPVTYVGELSNRNELWSADISLCTVYIVWLPRGDGHRSYLHIKNDRQWC